MASFKIADIYAGVSEALLCTSAGDPLPDNRATVRLIRGDVLLLRFHLFEALRSIVPFNLAGGQFEFVTATRYAVTSESDVMLYADYTEFAPSLWPLWSLASGRIACLVNSNTTNLMAALGTTASVDYIAALRWFPPGVGTQTASSSSSPSSQSTTGISSSSSTLLTNSTDPSASSSSTVDDSTQSQSSTQRFSSSSSSSYGGERDESITLLQFTLPIYNDVYRSGQAAPVTISFNQPAGKSSSSSPTSGSSSSTSSTAGQSTSSLSTSSTVGKSTSSESSPSSSSTQAKSTSTVGMSTSTVGMSTSTEAMSTSSDSSTVQMSTSTQGQSTSTIGQSTSTEAMSTSTAGKSTSTEAQTTSEGGDPDTILLLHFEGVDGATTTTDGSTGGAGSPHTITLQGDAEIDDAQKKFGNTSVVLDGDADYVDCGDSADWTFSGDFTVECWFRITSLPADWYEVGILEQYQDASNYWTLNLFNYQSEGTYNLTWIMWSGGGNVLSHVDSAITPSTNTWYHIAGVRSGNNINTYFNGTKGSTTTTYSSAWPNFAGVLSAGRGVDGRLFVGGWIDEVRVSKVARYTSSFTPSGPLT